MDAGLEKCIAAALPPQQCFFPVSTSGRVNPRWNEANGQNTPVLLRNATLFDGTDFLPQPVDILFSKGIITSVDLTGSAKSIDTAEIDVVHLQGKYVTPGLIDMHSHHLVDSWPTLPATSAGHEMRPDFGPLTPFVRSLDGMKPYDAATKLIALGGVTSSLILPGSANIMGGEAWPVKNAVRPGENGEEVVEEMLVEFGIPVLERRRYIKMACRENPNGQGRRSRRRSQKSKL